MNFGCGPGQATEPAYMSTGRPSPGGTTKRRDNVMFFTATIGRPLTDWLSIAADYNYTRDQSNLPVFNYARSIFSITLSSRF